MRYQLLRDWHDYPKGTIFVFGTSLHNMPHLYELYHHRNDSRWFKIIKEV